MATLPKMDLSQIRLAARQRADQVNSQFVSDPELNSYINESLYELYDLLVTNYGEDYYVTNVERTTVANSQTVALPSDFYKLLGVDLQVNGSGGQQWVTLRPFDWAERNRNTWPNTQAVIGWWSSLRYRVRAGYLWLTPTPASGQTLRIWYVPRLSPLVDPLTITVQSLQAGDYVDFNGVVTLTAAASAGTNQFIIEDTDNATALNLAAAINANADLIADYGVSATVDENVVTINVTTSLGVLTSTSSRLAITGGSPTAPEGASQYTTIPTTTETTSDGISGWLEYVIVDAAIKCMQKEESNTSVLERQKAALVKRINDSASNRDAANPQHVADVTQTGQWYGDGWGGWGGGWGSGGYW